MKKTRQAKWRECPYCKVRGIEPAFRSGKLKCLLRHQVECQALHELEVESQTRPKIDVILAMVQRQQKDIAKLTSRIAILEERRKRKPSDQGWHKMTPKQCWARRTQNVARLVRTMLNEYYDGPCRFYRTRWECFQWLMPEEMPLSDLLQMALWPIIENRNGQVCLRNIETTDPYFLFKQIWGKKDAHDLTFIEDAFNQVGIPEEYYCKQYLRGVGAEFQRIVEKFQSTDKSGAGGLPHGCVPLNRVWQRIEALSDEIYSTATSLPSSETMMLSGGPIAPQQ